MKKLKIAILGRVPDKMTEVNQAYSWFARTVWQGLTLLDHDVSTINYKSNTTEFIEDSLHTIQPDILFTHLTFHAWHDTNRMMGLFDEMRNHYGTKVIHTLGDAREEPRYRGDVSFAFDMALIGQTKNIKKFSNIWNIPVHFWPYASLTQKEISKPSKGLNFQNKPVFTGTPHAYEDRKNFISLLSSRIPIHVVTTKSSQDLKNKTAELAASASCILALCTGYDIDHYTDCRYWQYGGAGAYIVGRKFKKMDDLIPDNLYASFDSYQHIEKAYRLIIQARKKDTQPIREKMFQFMQRYHSSKVRMKNTVDLIMGEADTVKAFLKEN